MSSGKDAARDVRHGRRGGRWIPDGVPMGEIGRRSLGPPCPVCDQPMVCGQLRGHAVCVGMAKAFDPKWTGCA